MDFIDTFELRFPGLDHAEVAANNPSSFRSVVLPTGKIAADPSPVAYVDGSRWLARCPNPICGGAERVNFDSGLFFCCECRNALWGHAYLRVTVPTARKRAEIEAVLLARPDWKVRAWRPDETVADLKAQNLAHGVPVTVGG